MATAAGDVALAAMADAIVVKWGYGGQGRGLLVGDAAEFAHSHEDGNGGALASAGDAEHQVKAPGQVVELAQGRGNAPEFGGRAPSGGSVVRHDAAQPGVQMCSRRA